MSPFQVTIIETIVKLDQQELQYTSLLQALAGTRGRFSLRHGAQGLVRQRRGRRLPAAVRHQGQLHRAVRAHHPTETHLQGGHLARR